jgi:hypothetical protein
MVSSPSAAEWILAAGRTIPFVDFYVADGAAAAVSNWIIPIKRPS